MELCYVIEQLLNCGFGAAWILGGKARDDNQLQIWWKLVETSQEKQFKNDGVEIGGFAGRGTCSSASVEESGIRKPEKRIRGGKKI